MDQAKEVNAGVFSLLGIYYGVINKTGKQVTVELDFNCVPLSQRATFAPRALTDLCSSHDGIFSFCLRMKVVLDPPQCSTARLI